MKYYELTCLISPNLSSEELNSFQEKINSLIQDEKGILGESSRPVKKGQVFAFGKNSQAHLITLNFQYPGSLENIEKKLKADGQILRYLILTKKLPKKIVLPAPPHLVKPKPKPKVELKEIEKKLEEILGE